ncbi:MAG: LptF/LptG family permease [Microscillaceae bacterium]|nr:LptF/LptG family permease [Microscillaceae bacterium]MDW8461524.1 LptF/LptG family permease [Cytophagales bacterium]
MLKKVDSFIIRNFIGIFLLTFSVVLFILLLQVVVNYFKELVGKDISYQLFAELMSYFALSLTPQALPLAVLVGTLMAFGNLGEHYELTALKGAGISLPRVLLPVGMFCFLLTILSFWFQERVVPWANLQAYSLLYDLKQKKPTLDIKEGVFYNGIPGYSIKIKQKYKDGKTLKGIIIYNHTQNAGNREVILADSGKMYTILNERYLVLELFNGNSYNDQQDYSYSTPQASRDRFVRNSFKQSKLVFSLASFDLSRTDQSLFLHNRQMKNTRKLWSDLDSIQKRAESLENANFSAVQSYYVYYGKEWIKSDSIRKYYQEAKQKYSKKEAVREIVELIKKRQEQYEKQNAMFRSEEKLQERSPKEAVKLKINKKLLATEEIHTFSPNNIQVQMQENKIASTEKTVLERAVMQARNVRVATQSRVQELAHVRSDFNEYSIQIHKRYAESLGCLLMFLIGAPLGAIIKKGGLGVPIIISVAFFVVHYILTMTGEKWAKENFVSILAGMWTPNLILLLVGLFFLQQAKNDSRLLEVDAYFVWFYRLKEKWKKQKEKIKMSVSKG